MDELLEKTGTVKYHKEKKRIEKKNFYFWGGKKKKKGAVFSKNGQLVYVKNIITGKSEEEENEYTATVSKIFNVNQAKVAHPL